MEYVQLPNKLNDFRSLVRKTFNMTAEQEELFFSIPEEIWDNFLTINFGGNLEYATRVIFDRKDIIENLDDLLAYREKSKILNLDFATKKITDSILSKTPILFVTDFDNDGSLSQSIINEFIRGAHLTFSKEDLGNIYVEYARQVANNPTRGFTMELIQDLVKEHNIDTKKEFVIITADNGINSFEEQKKIQKAFPNAFLIVTDHHEPEENMVVVEDNKTVIVNPKFNTQSEELSKERKNIIQPTIYDGEFNISGATTVGVLLRSVLDGQSHKLTTEKQLEEYKQVIDNITQLSKISNVLDYVNTRPEDKIYDVEEVSHYAKLQPLLNTNNSLGYLINVNLPEYPELEKSLTALNTQARVALSMVKDFQQAVLNNDEHKVKILSNAGFYSTYLENFALLETDFGSYVLKLEEKQNAIEAAKAFAKVNKKRYTGEELANFEKDLLSKKDLYLRELSSSHNENYIEQLRPYIFSLSVNKAKSPFEIEALTEMENIYKELKRLESKLLKEIRQKEGLIKIHEKEHVKFIEILDDNFNRKLIGRAFNLENNGFNLTIDRKSKTRLSGSFRSLFDIDEFKKELTAYCKKHHLTLETPGHQRAAGFILTANKGEISDNVLTDLVEIINKKIKTLQQEKENVVEIDGYNFHFLDELNKVMRGSIPHFYAIEPVMKLHQNNIYVDKKTNAQMSLEDYVAKNKYGYTPIEIDFDGRVLIIPTELLRKVIQSGKNEAGFYNLNLKLGYVNEGTFMVSNVIQDNNIADRLSFIKDQSAMKKVDEIFSDGKLDNVVHYSREDLRKLPFFANNRYGEVDFENFENILISIIDSNKIDRYITLDVEANGFSNAKMFNIGACAYSIHGGNEISLKDFEDNSYLNIKNSVYLIKNPSQLKELNEEELSSLLKSRDTASKVLVKMIDGEKVFYYYEGEKEKINNHLIKDKKVVINRHIEGEGLYRLIKEEDFKLPFNMSYLTGVTNEHLEKYGKSIRETDEVFFNFLKKGKVMIGAHNGSYDNRIIKANTDLTFNVVSNVQQFDTARFAKSEMLAYDDTMYSNFVGLVEIPSDILFHNNPLSEVNLVNFLSNKNGEYPARNNKGRLVFEDEQLYFVNEDGRKTFVSSKTLEELGAFKKVEEKIQKRVADENYSTEDEKLDNLLSLVSLAKQEFLGSQYRPEGALSIQNSEDVSKSLVKFSVQELSNQLTVRNIILDKIDFDIKPVDLDKLDLTKITYNTLWDSVVGSHEPLTVEDKNKIYIFMNTYRFDKNFAENVKDQPELAEIGLSPTSLVILEEAFLYKNKELQNAFNDSWYYKEILSIKNPQRKDKDLNKHTLEYVSKVTGFDEKVVKKVLTDALDYRHHYGVKGEVIPKEIHVNGPIDGDVVFETALTLTMLANKRMSNTINVRDENLGNKFVKPLEIFNRESHFFTIQQKEANENSNIFEDSMGYAQLVSFDREGLSALSKEIKRQNKEMENGSKTIRFKLSKETLPLDTHVVAITNKGLTVENIQEDAKKIAFILENNQASNIENPMIKSLYQNEERISQLKSELSENYCFLHFSSEVKDLKSINDWIYEKEWTSRSPTSFKRIVTDAVDISTKQLEEIYEKTSTFTPKNEEVKLKFERINEILKEEIEYRKNIDFKTHVEYYEGLKRGSFNLLKDNPEDVLNNTIKRINPTKYALTNFNIYELIKEGVLNSLYKRDLKKSITYKS